MTKVYVIESPSFSDILDNRKEGGALSKILGLCKIKNEVYSVSDSKTLQTAFNRIADDINLLKSNLGGVCIHFSLHGSVDGIELSDKTFLQWQVLYSFIKDFNIKIDYVRHESGRYIPPTYLVFSVCDGYSAKSIKDFDDDNYSTYTALIGPTEPVTWADSLLAYSIFYHNIFIKQLGIEVALENMNKTVGLKEVFKVDIDNGL
ncbi:hypothetical protein [Flavobacterium sp. KACC 22761]|uniref:hypothetical protein n=1 Tax=Flavobacterium sp. KACC 22761 TaxID=3092665 RepID=UPI002A75B947|nr:hypothetical protein [Flavobacterium sp. KACC 22761]WPO77197.1 hypothetical protein SCB73_13085 [Flavobacterium sp. KACC 22761]